MKKLASIILMVIMMVLGTAAYAEQGDGIWYSSNYYEVEEIMNEYCELRGLYDWQIGNDVKGTLYGCGGICKENFESEYGMPWSIEAFNKSSIDEFDICEIHTYEIETIDGIKMYRAQAQSETTPLGYKDNEPYYCADVIFMVFSFNEE